jgi:hypothetical protein
MLLDNGETIRYIVSGSSESAARENLHFYLICEGLSGTVTLCVPLTKLSATVFLE